MHDSKKELPHTTVRSCISIGGQLVLEICLLHDSRYKEIWGYFMGRLCYETTYKASIPKVHATQAVYTTINSKTVEYTMKK